MKRGPATGSPPERATNAHISCWVFGMRKTPTPPLPLWERASGLGAAGSLRPRRLGRKGEGRDRRVRTEEWVSINEASCPSPGLPKLASSLRQTVLSQSGEEVSRSAQRRFFHRAMCECDSLFRGTDPTDMGSSVQLRQARRPFCRPAGQPLLKAGTSARRDARPVRGRR